MKLFTLYGFRIFFFHFSCPPSQLWQNILLFWIPHLSESRATQKNCNNDLSVFWQSRFSTLCNVDLRPIFFVMHTQYLIEDNQSKILNRFWTDLCQLCGILVDQNADVSLSKREWLELTFFLATLFQSLQISNNKEHLYFLSHPPWHGCLYWMFLDQVNLSAPPCKSQYKTQW